jgi:hypothetical protein
MTIRAGQLRSSVPFPGAGALAFGADARRIDEVVLGLGCEWSDTGTRAVARGELLDALRNAGADGWNGSGTKAMSATAYLRGENFLARLPHAFASPSIAAAPDGSVAMEWLGPDRRSFSVQIDARDAVSIAWSWGAEYGYAWTHFDDGIPAEILDRLRKTLA